MPEEELVPYVENETGEDNPTLALRINISESSYDALLVSSTGEPLRFYEAIV